MVGYEIWVESTARDYTVNPQEWIGDRLDKCMRSPYTSHIVMGRAGGEELIFAEYGRAQSDADAVVTEACCVYCCRVGCWPDFLISNGKIRKISAVGMAPPGCLAFMYRRQMILLSAVEVEKYTWSN